MASTTSITEVCTTCVRPVGDPHRRYDADGAVTEGCVDASHTGHLSDADDLAWHDRDDAVAIRLTATWGTAVAS